ncbi:MAG: hypothetical protein WA678_09230 [Rhabdochlamydiaceae bacterium]|jgi:hypothetical protein
MIRIVLSTMAIFSMGFGFANPTEYILEKHSCVIEAGDIGDDASFSEPPVLEKCKGNKCKKKKNKKKKKR